MGAQSGPRGFRWAVAAGFVVLGIVLTTVGLVSGGGTTEPGTGPAVPAVPATPTPVVTEPQTVLSSKPVRPSPAAGEPRRLVLPRLRVDAPVVPIGVTDGTLIPPGDPQVLGWWRDGAVPGALRGGALLTGHTVHTGGGALDDLEDVRRGDEVRVRTDRGTVTYAVQHVRIFRKASLAEAAARLFSQEVPGRLVLVTCEDWDGTKYLSNVVVLARPVG